MEISREFSKDETQMPENHLKKYSTFLDIRKMKIENYLKI